MVLRRLRNFLIRRLGLFSQGFYFLSQGLPGPKRALLVCFRLSGKKKQRRNVSKRAVGISGGCMLVLIHRLAEFELRFFVLYQPSDILSVRPKNE